MHIPYATITQEWRAFDNVFLVVYSPEKEQNLMSVLGDYADADNSSRIAAKNASDEIYTLTGNDQFFAWFNRGTSLVNLQPICATPPMRCAPAISARPGASWTKPSNS